MADPGGKIPQTASMVTTGVFYALAISAAISRTVIRVRLGQGLEIDDGLLFLACIFITSSTVLLYISMSDVYVVENLVTHPASASTYHGSRKSYDWFRDMLVAHEFMCQSALFAIRLSFLFFFRRLIDRLGRIIYYWRVTVFVTAAIFLSWASLAFITFWTTEQILSRTSILIAIGLLLSIGNELMVVAIPIWVLWRVKIKLRQKLSLGIFLCSNSMIAIMACIQVLGIQTRGRLDVTWYVFWLQLQSSTAVSVFSFTAFRSLFIAENSKSRADKKKMWHPPPIRLLRRTIHDTWYGGNHILLQSFPSATLTGMRTFIRGGNSVNRHDTESGIHHSGDVLLQDPGK